MLGILLGHPPLYLLILDEAATACVLVEEKEVICESTEQFCNTYLSCY